MEKLSYKQLQSRAKKVGIPQNLKKVELIRRLTAHADHASNPPEGDGDSSISSSSSSKPSQSVGNKEEEKMDVDEMRPNVSMHLIHFIHPYNIYMHFY